MSGNITVCMNQICPSTLTFVVNTIRCVLQKIKAVFDTNPPRFKTLRQMLEAEKEMHGAQWPKVGATLALMWLKRFVNISRFCVFMKCEHCTNPESLCTLSTRVLRFIEVFLLSLADGEKDDSNPNLIRVNVAKAYEVAMKRYHGWFLQQLFKVSSRSPGFREGYRCIL